jgi:hypothetical protein
MTCRVPECTTEVDAGVLFCTVHRVEGMLNAPATPAEAAAVEETATCEDCDSCGDTFPVADGELAEYEGERLCPGCLQDATTTPCADCSYPIQEGDEYRHNGDTLCSSCHDDRTHSDCENCGSNTHEDDLNNEGVCSNCEEDDSSVEREWSSDDLPEFQSLHGGDIITSRRIFSAEVEAYYSSHSDLESAAYELPRAFGVEHDGSLSSNGIEFQTPKLQGKHGEDAIKNMCTILNRHDFRVNGTTGLHIHLDGAGLIPASRRTEPKAMKDMLCFYMAMEDVMLSFLPRSRRSNRYCLSLTDGYSMDKIRDVKTIAGLESIWYKSRVRSRIEDRKSRKYDESRYYGVNFHSLLKDGHVEIRFHSGTLNATKILEWTNLHQRVIDSAVETTLCERAMAGVGLSLREKTVLMYDLLGLTDRSRAYFDARQITFNPELAAPIVTDGETAPEAQREATERDNLDEVCAG